MSAESPRDADGYRRSPVGGPIIRADVIDVYVARRRGEGIEFLQLLRATPPLAGSWHPVMGHCERGETATACALRELREEVGLDLRAGGGEATLWALEQTHPYFVAEIDSVVLGPRFAALVGAAWEPTLNAEHSRHRWTAERDIDAMFLWPGQRAAAREAAAIVRGDPSGDWLRVATAG